MPEPAYTITGESVTVVIRGETFTVKKLDPNFGAARQAVLEKRWEDVPSLVSKGFTLEKWAGGDFQFKQGFMRFRGDKLPHSLNARMIRMATQGEDPTFLMKFWERLQNNPSFISVTELYPFLENRGIAIDSEGFLLTYKSVTRGYKDFHTGTIDNSIGAKPWMPRNKVSDKYNSECHNGFHVGNLSYGTTFKQGYGNRVIICRVDPANVVTVCTSAQKIRVNTYEVIGNYGDALPDTSYDTSKDEATQKDVKTAAGDWADKLSSAPKIKTPLKKEGEIWRTFGELTDEQLAEQTMANLRKYASRVLKIIGASKLRKFADDSSAVGLIDRIIDVRSEK